MASRRRTGRGLCTKGGDSSGGGGGGNSRAPSTMTVGASGVVAAAVALAEDADKPQFERKKSSGTLHDKLTVATAPPSTKELQRRQPPRRRRLAVMRNAGKSASQSRNASGMNANHVDLESGAT